MIMFICATVRTKFFSPYNSDRCHGEFISHLQPAVVSIFELLGTHEINMVSRGHIEGSCWVHWFFLYFLFQEIRLFAQFSSQRSELNENRSISHMQVG